MNRIRWFAAIALCLSPYPVLADEVFEGLFGLYLQRVEGVTIGAGDAKAVNAASQVIDPWPKLVRNRRIPGNGQRMSGAILRYQDVRKLKETPAPLSPDSISATGFSGSSSSK